MTTEIARNLTAEGEQSIPAPMDLPPVGEVINLDASEN
ncbi:MAG: polyphosphate kinase, partial [Marinobacter maritimus]